MQRGIDSFFKRVTPAAKNKAESPEPETKKKRKALVISSDEDDAIPASPQVNSSSKSREHKKSRIETITTKSNDAKLSSKPTLSKLKNSPNKERKAIDPAALFGTEPVRVEAPKPPKPKELAVLELEDDEIDKSLMDIDVDKSILESEKAHELTAKSEKTHDSEKEERHSRSSKSKTPKKDSSSKDSSSTKSSKSPKHKSSKSLSHSSDKSSPPKKEKSSESHKHKEEHLSPSSAAKKPKHESDEDIKTPKVELKHSEKEKEKSAKKPKHESDEIKTPKVEHKHKEKEKEKSAHKTKAKSTPKVKRQHSHDDLESSVLTDEERHERKRMAAVLFQKFKNRSSVINPGSKEVPKGTPNCLAGHTFLVTGVLESLERDEAGSIIKEYGGKVMSTVGKRLNYLIAGEDAGPKKLADAEELGIKVISEDGLFDLIREKSGGKAAQKNGNAAKEEKLAASPKLEKEKAEVKIKQEKTISPEKKRKLEENVKKDEHKNNSEIKIKKESVKIEEKPLEFVRAPKQEVDESMLAWVDKYKPTSVKEIVGQFGASSNVVKLTNWLSKWYVNHDGKKKLQKPNPWAKNDDGSFYKAALLSGPPGIGKTTTATLVCKELGFDTVEFNASDTRSKRLLKEEVAELLSCKSLYGYFHGNEQAVTKKHVLIMDEVDGMAGNEDRGGIQELIALIKDSSVPIICMCNDRNHQKMRSLVNYCYDLRFNKPRLEQIKGRIMSICCKEKFKIEPAKLEEIITATNNDIRQTINHISLLSAGKHLPEKAVMSGEAQKTAEKDLKIGPWEVVRKVFSADEHKHMSFFDKCDLFFHDYSLSPLFVQQNYLQVSPVGPKSDVMRKVALTADALSLGDLVDKRIRSNAAWALLPTQAVFSSVMPGEYMCGHFTGQINFPGWLGKNSRSSKRSRLAQEIHDHTRLRTSGSRQSIRLDYAPYLLANIVRPLKEQGLEGVHKSLDVLKEYHLLREDIDGLIDLTTWPGKKGIMDAVDGRVKAALTRTYNKEVMPYSYSATAGVKKKRAEAADDAAELLGVEGEEGAAVLLDSDEEKDDDNLENDGLIKAKKKPASAAASTSKASTSKASTSKAKTATKAGGAGKTKATASTSKAKK